MVRKKKKEIKNQRIRCIRCEPLADGKAWKHTERRYFCKDKDGQDRAKLLTDDRQRENQETEQGRVASLTSSLGGVGEGRRRRRAARVPWE